MNISELSASQLRRAALIKEQIEKLEKELTSILAAPTASATAPEGPKTRRIVSAATRVKMAAAQQKRWAAKQPVVVAEKPTSKRRMSAAAKAAISQAAKARWAKIKAAKK